MNHQNAFNKISWRQAAEYALLILPAIALGVLAMLGEGISPVSWGQQLAGWLIFPFLFLPLQRFVRKISATILSALLLLPLAAVLFSEATGGAKRWLSLIVFQVNVAMLVLPALLVTLRHTKYFYPVWLGAAIVLCFQPDASQLTSFAAALLPILWLREKKPLWRAVSMGVCCVLIYRCVNTVTSLEPVSYCEGVLSLLGKFSPLLQAAGCLTLAAVPLFFLYRFCTRKEPLLLSLSIYYAVSMLFVLSGEYPVPFMGFGISPIAGYWLAHLCHSAINRHQRA